MCRRKIQERTQFIAGLRELEKDPIINDMIHYLKIANRADKDNVLLIPVLANYDAAVVRSSRLPAGEVASLYLTHNGFAVGRPTPYDMDQEFVAITREHSAHKIRWEYNSEQRDRLAHASSKSALYDLRERLKHIDNVRRRLKEVLVEFISKPGVSIEAIKADLHAKALKIK